MKRIYLALLMAFSIGVTSQEMTNDTAKKNVSPKSKSIDTYSTRNKIPGFKLYPNPVFEDIVYVTTKKNDTKDIVIYDVFGKAVLKDRISSNTLNISRLTPGIYVLSVTEDKKTMTRKLVVK